MDPVTVTLNPAIDHTVFLDRLGVGSVNRVRRHHLQPGGKGVNVSAMLADYGIPSTATGLLGEGNAGLFEELFAARAIADAFVRMPGETRTGLKIIDEAARETTDLNFPGLTPGPAAWEALESTLRRLAAAGRWFVIGGSLPAGLPAARLGRLIAMLKQEGCRVAADTSGEALRVAVASGVDLVKPNEHELAGLLGRPLPDGASRVDAARELHACVPHVALSLGADGAVFLAPDGGLRTSAPPAKVIGTVGAGDALLAGYLAGLSAALALEARARLATVFAWAALEDIARRLPGKEIVRQRLSQVEVTPLFPGPP